MSGDYFLWPVILSGGSGTRLWPLSTHAHPKQFHSLLGELSMIAATADRVADTDCYAPPIVIGNAGHAALLKEELAGYKTAAMILEPVARNTAAAIAIAALVAEAKGEPDLPMLVLPSDHAIVNVAAFTTAALLAMDLARAGQLVTFGIVPGEPHTGYGYIKRGAPLSAGINAHRIERFVEKPALDEARAMLADGGYSWNSGMFVFTARAVLDEFTTHAPDILAACRAVLASSRWDGDVLLLDEETFAAVPSQAFDVAIMEKTARACVVRATFDWTDVGSWPALHDVVAHDERGNTVWNKGMDGTMIALADSTTNCYVRNETSVPVFVSGVDDISVVVTSSGIVVTSRDGAQNVRQAASLFDKKK